MNTNQSHSSHQIASVAQSIEEMINDTSVHAAIEMNGVKVEDVTDLLTSIRKRLIAKRWREAE